MVYGNAGEEKMGTRKMGREKGNTNRWRKENGERRGTGQPQTKLEIHPDSDAGNIPVILFISNAPLHT